MIIVRILGGLGNQMFQYAYAKSLEMKGYEVQLDLSKIKKYKLHGGYQLDKYKIDLKTSNSFNLFLSKINPFKTLKEKNLLFDKNLTNLKGNEYLKGYFQTEKYFSDIRSELIHQFVLKEELSNSTKLYKTEILKSETSCSIHIRRGDYVTDSKSNTIHGTCSLAYYKEAIKIINKKHSNVTFFIFSDDINWTKDNLVIENAVYINHKCLPHEDIYLMSLCKHNITANSSFSWWGAWLNRNKNKTIIAPKNWFVDKVNEIACQNWIKI
ncbi:alpha-1,2-fucosyltransferase [Polaribacter sp. BM10]|uniref:alpha-1,2-fucosyltransferase n=1 Tax=Polaribacter sp. BM10 TaxID=1529069 RepID=UPI000989D4ED|nr:alpha-1,2-fucosyltransferase [Polaribacter sp. BM10]AQS93523.1 alpha-1,2-fucosyltransferase [Polaribacter sp. BM10]